jgi:hypothetical protein
MTAESENQASFKLPPVVAVNVQPDPLESLRSPQLDILNLKNRSLERDSLAGSEFNDIALDDDVFSPVALTARPVVAPDTSISHDRGEIHKDNTDKVPNDLPSGPVLHPVVTTIMDPPRSHKKTVSTTTIRSSHTRKASLLVNLLDLQETNRKNRGSVDGHLKLQEEFHRLHERENQKEHTSTENTIDWGASSISVQWSCVAEYEDLKIFGEL